MHELRAALRALRATPLVTIIAMMSLALGIGANTAIFSILDSLLLRSLPVARPDRLVAVDGWSSYPFWEQIRERRRDLFENAAAFGPARFNLSSGGETDLVDGLWVSGEYFDTLGVPAILGRTLTVADDRAGGGDDGPVMVISHACWQRRFGGAADVIGRTLTIDGVAFTIVGVTPPGFDGGIVGRGFDIAVPFGSEPLVTRGDSRLNRTGSASFLILARLKDGQTIDAAANAIHAVQPQIREALLPSVPPEWGPGFKKQFLVKPIGVAPAATGVSAGTREGYSLPVISVMAVVVAVLLIACANIANLLLARAIARRHEFSVRVALGASRWRLARHLLTESLLLAAGGAGLGLLLARWASDLLVRQLSTSVNTIVLDVSLDSRVLAFTMTVAIATALLFGVVPAFRASRADPIDAIREHGRGAAGGRRLGLGQWLTVIQVALSLVLIVAAGLLVRTFVSLATRDLGFDREPVLIARLNIGRVAADATTRPALLDRLTQTVRDTPGVAAVAGSTLTPVSGSLTDMAIEIDDGRREMREGIAPFYNIVTPGWFETYGTRLVAGRDFASHDTAASAPVAIVNESFVRTFLQGGSPIGRRLRNPLPPPGESNAWHEVIGVVRDAAYRSVRSNPPSTVYFPIAQQPRGPAVVSLSVRAAGGSPALLARSVADAIGRVDRRIDITFAPLTRQLADSTSRERLMAMLSAFFGALSLLLAGLGLYGVMSYTVSRRVNEIAVRIALGAERTDIIRTILGRVALLIAAGLIIGSGLSWWAVRYLTPLLYGLTPHDPTTLLLAGLVLAAVGTIAGWLPARRAARVDPIRALRAE